ncbi:MAG: hypothetical protein ACYCYN_11210, partial [Solirubrobacteraceae bacterium]
RDDAGRDDADASRDDAGRQHRRAARTRHDGPLADVGASVLRWLTGDDAQHLPGRSFVDA